MSRASLAIALVAGVAAAAGGVATVTGRPEGNARAAYLIGSDHRLPRLYAPSSAFNQPIPDDAAVDPDSTRLVDGLAEAVRDQGFVLAVHRWTVPVYVAGPRTPRYTVSLTADWAPEHELADVPIPRAAQPDPAGDGHLAILDRPSGCEYDLWQARRDADGWSASWANGLPFRGSGVYPDGMSARGSGFALLAGVIRPEELQRGRIRHALAFSYPYTSAAGYVAPATETDGRSDRPDALPEGARLQLDPSFDTSSLPPYQQIIARAMQQYGMYLADTSSNVSLYAVNPQSYTDDPYAGVLPDETYPDLSDIPIDRFRVLDSGPVTPPGGAEAVRTDCARFR